jgi:hypothetical protein
MMLCLVDDIGRDRFHIGLADGEGTVSIFDGKDRMNEKMSEGLAHEVLLLSMQIQGIPPL